MNVKETSKEKNSSNTYEDTQIRNFKLTNVVFRLRNHEKKTCIKKALCTDFICLPFKKSANLWSSE